MPSPSVALLSALVTGKGRPKRLLVQENAPAFVSSIGRVAGSSCVNVAAYDIDDVIHGLLRTEGLSPDHVWGIATHRGGKLSPTDWLSRCAASGIPTVELCMGSLGALASWGPSPATFTIVDLDAEEAFAGARLTALLTSDRATAARVQQLCLPGPEDQDYIIDARPRGLADDEPALISMVEHAMALFAGKGPAEGAPNALTLPWARRFQSPDGDSSVSPRSPDAGPGPVEEHVWSTRLAAVEAHHTQAIREAAANAASLQSKLEEQFALADEWQRRCRAAERAAASQAERDSAAFSEIQKKLDYQQRTIDQWEARFNEAESEAAKDAAILSGARADLLRERNESEGALASVRAEKEALAQRLLRTEWERDAAMKNPAASDPRTTSELRHRVEQLEEAAAASADREARQAEAAEALRAQWSARVVRLEADAVVFGKARADLQKRKVDAEHSLALIQAEKEALTEKLADLDAELGEALSDAAKRAAAQRSALEEQSQRAARLEDEVASLTAREATRAREWEASRDSSSRRIAALEAEVLAGQKALTEKAEKEQALGRLEAESAARIEKLAEVESDRDRLLAEGVERERALHSAIDEERRRAEELAKTVAGLEEQSQRAARLEDEVASLTAREATRAREWAAAQAGLLEQIRRLEAGAALAGHQESDVRARFEEYERSRALFQSEREALSEKLRAAEGARDLARADAAGRDEAQRAEIEEQRQRAAQLERDAAVRTEQEKKLIAEWGAQRAALTERIAGMKAAAGEAEKARADLIAQKAQADQARDSTRAERDALIGKLTLMEKEHFTALAEAASREDAQRVALEAEKRRAGKLAGEAAALVEREAKLIREGEESRSELMERIRGLEGPAALFGNAQAELLAQKTEAERAFALMRAERETMIERLADLERDLHDVRTDAARRQEAHHAELEELKRREEQVKLEAKAAAEREAKQAEAREASRADLGVRIARLEAAEVVADKARTELLNRKRDSDRALATAQAEVLALIKKLATAERELEEVHAAHGPARGPAVRPATGHAKPPTEPAPPSSPGDVLGQHNSGGLSALVNLWSTAVIRRPSRSRESEEKPPDPPVEAVPGMEAIPDEAPSPDGSVPRREGDGHGKPPDVAPKHNTGGLTALVGLWNTAKTMRPQRRKEPEGRPPDPPVKLALDMEVIPDEAPSQSAPAQVQGAPAPPRPNRPASSGPARPTRRPEPKPAPAPDETEKLGGWLRDLAGRVRGKPK